MKSAAAGKSFFLLITVSTCVCYHSSKKNMCIKYLSMVVLNNFSLGNSCFDVTKCSNGYDTESFDGVGGSHEKNKVKWEEMASMLLIML